VPDVHTRLAFLEKLVGGLAASRGQGEALTPTYLTIDPATGKTGAAFTGTVSANGIVIPADTLGHITPQTHGIWWSRQSDGAMVAELTGTTQNADSSGETFLDCKVFGPETGGSSIGWQLDGNVATPVMLLTLNGAAARRLFAADGTSDFLQGSDNLSDLASAATARANLGLGTAAVRSANHWPQLPADQATQDLWGAVTAAGAISGTSSGGWTVAHTGTGVYTVTFGTPFKDTGYSIQATLHGAGFAVPTAAGKLVGSCVIDTFSSAVALADTAFDLRIIGAT
jgi:hypothetical protein